MIIDVWTCDKKIWNLPEVLIAAGNAMSRSQDLVLDFKSEGPDLNGLDLTPHLLKMCDLYNYDPARICVRTDNLVQGHECFNVKKSYNFNRHAKPTMLYDRSISKSSISKHFGFFIGRNNAPRALIGSVLHRYHNDKTIHTNHFSFDDEFSLANLGLEELIIYHGHRDISPVVRYLMSCPIGLDAKQLRERLSMLQIEKKRVSDCTASSPATFVTNDEQQLASLYDVFFAEIVCESYYTGSTFFPTEKTWRPILLETPFVVQGPRNFLTNLKSLGFETFDSWWDEGYDQDEPNISVPAVLELIDHIASQDMAQLRQWYQEMRPALEHNKNLFLKIYNDKKRFPFTS